MCINEAFINWFGWNSFCWIMFAMTNCNFGFWMQFFRSFSWFSMVFSLFHCRSCIIGPQLEVKVCTLGTVINRTAYPSDYCQLEGTGRQSQPMPIRWMSWESVLLVSSMSLSFAFMAFPFPTSQAFTWTQCATQIYLDDNFHVLFMEMHTFENYFGIVPPMEFS